MSHILPTWHLIRQSKHRDLFMRIKNGSLHNTSTNTCSNPISIHVICVKFIGKGNVMDPGFRASRIKEECIKEIVHPEITIQFKLTHFHVSPIQYFPLNYNKWGLRRSSFTKDS